MMEMDGEISDIVKCDFLFRLSAHHPDNTTKQMTS